MPDGHILITGASGLVGRAAMEHFAKAGYRVTAVSRRKPFDTYGATWLSVDPADKRVLRGSLRSHLRMTKGDRVSQSSSW